MRLEHHDLDVYPIPKEKAPMFINEPWLIDDSNYEQAWGHKEPEDAEDNIRVYIPLDINREAILLSQVAIYDQIWYVRHMPEDRRHSKEAVDVIREFVKKLEEIPDGCAEIFPFELIDELKEEFL